MRRAYASCLGGCFLTALALVSSAGRAEAFKWKQCPPPPVPVNASTLGGTNSPFIHPGHELTIVLNDSELQASGGFSTDPDGNRIQVTFASLFGAPIALAPRAVGASSAASLTLAFPDTLAEVGRTLAGPVEVVVETNGGEVAHISAADLVALPAAVDVTPILSGDTPQETVPAALGANGDLWLPASFSGKPMGGMPGCEGDDFLMPMPVNIGGAVVVGTVMFPFDPTERIRGISGYLGDIVLNGTSYYGLLYPERIQLRQIGDTLGVSLCRLNDATSLVLRVDGDRSWAQPGSPFRLVARDSSPLALRLQSAPAVPRSDTGALQTNSGSAPGRLDSLGNQCSTLTTTGKSALTKSAGAAK